MNEWMRSLHPPYKLPLKKIKSKKTVFSETKKIFFAVESNEKSSTLDVTHDS